LPIRSRAYIVHFEIAVHQQKILSLFPVNVKIFGSRYQVFQLRISKKCPVQNGFVILVEKDSRQREKEIITEKENIVGRRVRKTGNSYVNVEETMVWHLLCDVIKRLVRMKFFQKRLQMMKTLMKVTNFHED